MNILCDTFSFNFGRTRHSSRPGYSPSPCSDHDQNSPETQPESVSTVFPVGFSLGDLPDDLHSLLIEELQKCDGLYTIRSLSLVSKRLRNICLPSLFRVHEWHIRESGRDRALLPSKLWPYIHTFHLVWSASDAQQESKCEALISALPAMASLTTFTMSAPVGAWPALMTGILNIPALECLEINCWAIPSPIDQFHNVLHNRSQDTSRTPWRKFISTITLKSRGRRDRTANVVTAPVFEFPADAHFVHPPSRMAFRGMYPPRCFGHDISAGMWAPEIVLIPPSLEHLELQGDLSNFCNLKAWEWSNLRELVLRDTLPQRREDPADLPLIDVLVLMPRLETLDVSYKYLPNPPPIWPLEQPRSDSGPAPHSVRAIPPQLRNLLLSNPSFEDNTFSQLPPSLRSLYIRRTQADPSILSFRLDQALQILQASDLRSLTSLGFTIRGPLEASLFAFLGRTFPALEVLELQRHTLDGGYFTESSDELGAILRDSHLEHLKVLRLDIGPAIFYPTFPCLHSGTFKGGVAWARSLASYIPWLRQICLAQTPHSWFTIDVSRPIHLEGIPCKGSAFVHPLSQSSRLSFYDSEC